MSVGMLLLAGLPIASLTMSRACRWSTVVLESITEPVMPPARSASRSSSAGSLRGGALVTPPVSRVLTPDVMREVWEIAVGFVPDVLVRFRS